MGHGPGWYAFMQAQEEKKKRQKEYEKRQKEYEQRQIEYALKKTEIEEWKREHMSTRKCPKCGGVMYIREGKYGKFLGCSRYPRCKGTLKL